MSTPTPATDTTLVNRAGVDYRTTLDKMSTLQDTDLLLVNRAGVDYKCTAADIKAILGGGGVGDASDAIKAVDVGEAIQPGFTYLSSDGKFMVGEEGKITWKDHNANLDIVYGKTPYGWHCSPRPGAYSYVDLAGAKHNYPGAPGSLTLMQRQTRYWYSTVSGTSNPYSYTRLPRYGNTWGYMNVGNSPGQVTQAFYFTDPSIDVTAALAGLVMESSLTPSSMGVTWGLDNNYFWRYGKDYLLWRDNTYKYRKVTFNTTSKKWEASAPVTAALPPAYMQIITVCGDYLVRYHRDTKELFRSESKSKLDTFIKVNTGGIVLDFSGGSPDTFYRSKAGNYYFQSVNGIDNFWAVSKDEGLTWTRGPKIVSPNQASMFEPDFDLYMVYTVFDSNAGTGCLTSVSHLP